MEAWQAPPTRFQQAPDHIRVTGWLWFLGITHKGRDILPGILKDADGLILQTPGSLQLWKLILHFSGSILEKALCLTLSGC